MSQRQDREGRDVGYDINARCDFETCDVVIERGLAYRCGGAAGGTSDGPGCGNYYCAEHLYYPGQLCPACNAVEEELQTANEAIHIEEITARGEDYLEHVCDPDDPACADFLLFAGD